MIPGHPTEHLRRRIPTTGRRDDAQRSDPTPRGSVRRRLPTPREGTLLNRTTPDTARLGLAIASLLALALEPAAAAPLTGRGRLAPPGAAATVAVASPVNPRGGAQATGRAATSRGTDPDALQG